jgi:ATP-dependent protease ClpP protease subunit
VSGLLIESAKFSPLSNCREQLTPSMAIYDTIQSIKSPVGTLALGYAYNNAGLLLSAGAKVLFFCL